VAEAHRHKTYRKTQRLDLFKRRDPESSGDPYCKGGNRGNC
jgi:hypothetical protein